MYGLSMPVVSELRIRDSCVGHFRQSPAAEQPV